MRTGLISSMPQRRRTQLFTPGSHPSTTRSPWYAKPSKPSRKMKENHTNLYSKVGLKDVAENCADALLAETAKPSPHYFKVFGPRAYGSLDLKEAVEEITGKKYELKLVEKDQLLDYWKQIVPEFYAEEFKEMTTCGLADGIIAKNFVYDENTVRGKVELVDALRSLYKK